MEKLLERQQELLSQIKELEELLSPIKTELDEVGAQIQKLVEDKIKKAHAMKDKFSAEELVFAAHARCACGAGLAYPKHVGMHGSWDCSDILLGLAKPEDDDHALEHCRPVPFAFYEVKSENQPSANGCTTRRK